MLNQNSPILWKEEVPLNPLYFCITASNILVLSAPLVAGIEMTVVQYPRGPGRLVSCSGRSRFQMGGRNGIRCQMGMAHQYHCRDPLSHCCFHWERGRVLCRIERYMGRSQQGGWNRLGWEDHHRWSRSLVDLGCRSDLRYRL